MKKIFALALAATAVVACSKNEGTDNGSRVSSQVDQLKVLTSVSTQTRTAVDGVVLPKGSAIGVQVTQTSNDNALLVGKTTGAGIYEYYTNGNNVRFSNEAAENTWASVTTEGKTKLLLLEASAGAGKVRGYYPYTDAIEGIGAENAKIPVDILKVGTITVGDELDPSDPSEEGGYDDKLAYTAPEETDYMYDATTADNEVSATTTTTAKLTLAHALSRVSFRMYTSHDAQAAVKDDAASYYEFVGYTIKNKSGADELHANYDQYTKMKISNGDIEGDLAGGEIVRKIEGYKMVQSEGNDDTNNTKAADSSYRVSNLVFPLASIEKDGSNPFSKNIEVVFEIVRVDKDGVKSEPIGYALPFAIVDGKSDKWEKGKNYTYTVKFTGNALSIETVTVTDWVEVVGGNMEIE